MLYGHGGLLPLSSSYASPDLMAVVESAAQLPNGAKRDAALIEALRKCRQELDDAKVECYAARLRVSEAKDKFDSLAIMLAGIDPWTYSSSSTTSDIVIGDGSGGASTGKRGASCSPNRQSNEKLPKLSSPSSMASMEDGGGGGIDIPAPPIPTNPIHVPARYTGYSTTPSEQAIIDTHRENFYRKLLGIPASEIENYIPPPAQANLRSKSQLEEGIHIAQHWDTGDDELDAAAFRSRHKTWYSKMKPVTRDVGRRTGIHLRTLEPTLQSSPSSHGFRDGETVLCRYNKNGTKSILYIDVTQLFDALFEIHCLEQNHVRGNNAVKSRVDELYANITDGQVKTFLDTCPVCIERRGRPTTELGVVGKSPEV